MLKSEVNAQIDLVLIVGAFTRDYMELQQQGKLNIVDLVMYIEKIDEYTAIERCMSVLKMCMAEDKKMQESYAYLQKLKLSYRRPLPRKVNAFYERLEKKLARLSKDIFVLKDLVKWERHYTKESTLKRWLKQLQNWGYIQLSKKDKLTGYQYKLRFKKEVD